MKPIPSQYKIIVDKIICDIGDSINQLRPYVTEIVNAFHKINFPRIEPVFGFTDFVD